MSCDSREKFDKLSVINFIHKKKKIALVSEVLETYADTNNRVKKIRIYHEILDEMLEELENMS